MQRFITRDSLVSTILLVNKVGTHHVYGLFYGQLGKDLGKEKYNAETFYESFSSECHFVSTHGGDSYQWSVL